MRGLHDIEAILRFRTTQEGGRQGACRSPDGQYRPLCDLGGDDGYNGALCVFLDKEWVAPGEVVTTKIWFLHPDLVKGRLREGLQFGVYEGTKHVATATVTNVVNADLR